MPRRAQREQCTSSNPKGGLAGSEVVYSARTGDPERPGRGGGVSRDAGPRPEPASSLRIPVADGAGATTAEPRQTGQPPAGDEEGP